MSTKFASNGTLRKKIAGVFLALALSGAGIFGLAGPAAAAPSDCGLGLHCSYSGYDYGNDYFQGPDTHKFQNCVDDMYIGLRSYKNVASSAFNNGRTQVSYLYSGVNQTGSRISFVKGTGTPNLGTRSFNDMADSGYYSSTLGSTGTALCR
ncbi:hypothetical protein RS83_00967 [Microbacterium oxydans]|uniref:Peptidase inhibitor family I36 n=1 Tax=Microbacterium oxydans TaxID=82380 RepID=A0A0F0LAK1_9MICO|nr:hypothetical protein RS83_00967 [Microbacterium oxydans]